MMMMLRSSNLLARRSTAVVMGPTLNHSVRTFASAKDNFLKMLKEEIKHASEDADKSKELGKQSSPFKLVSESKSGKIVLGRELDGFKLRVLFDAKDLSYDYPPEEEEAAAGPVSSIPIQIEIAPVDSDIAMLVSGEVARQSGDEGQENAEENNDPYFSPSSIQTGKPGAITEDDFAPDIDELDEDLQDCFAEWLTDFEVDQDLFQLILDHAEKKENSMYVDWLKDFKKVVEGGKKQ
jgi:Mitochondrial glycoprotein